jgi:hypothetical protein
MTSLSTLHRDVAFGRSNGKIIWQPRIQCWYSDKTFFGEPLPERYRGMSIPEIYRSLGCSARLYQFNACFKRIEHPAVNIQTRPLSETLTEKIIETPVGIQRAVTEKTTSSWAILNRKYEVETEEELKVALWREENTRWEWDETLYRKLLGDLGDLGAPTMYMPRMNIQCLYIEKMGTQNGIYALYDWPDTVHAFFKALEASHDRLIKVINASPIDIINFGENIHAGTIPPDLFLEYHLPACQRRCEKLHAAGKFISAHWDGDCKMLLPYAKETGLDAIEAITPKPQGDVTLEEVKEALGDKLFLLDGLPAVYFDETYSVETLVECTNKIIDLFAPKLILGISDEISSTGDIERVRIVGDIVDKYNGKQT